MFSLEEGGILSGYSAVDYVRGIAPGVFVIVRSQRGAVRETLEYLGMGSGPNHVLYRPYHLTSLETPLSVARAAIYGEPAIVSGERPRAGPAPPCRPASVAPTRRSAPTGSPGVPSPSRTSG